MMNFSFASYKLITLLAQSVNDYSIVAKTTPGSTDVFLKLAFPVMIGISVTILLFFALLFSWKRYSKASMRKSKDKDLISQMTPEEIEKIYGGEVPPEIGRIDKMTREELRILAEKELQKEGRKVGEKDYLKGPLDWDDVDENFRPRPKTVRSDFSKKEPESQKIEDKETKNKEDKENLSPPPDILE